MARLSVVVGTAAMLVLLLVVDTSGRPSDMGLFFGRVHPTIVHFPIALLIIAGLTELLAWRGVFAESKLAKATAPLLFLAAWSAIVAAIAGLYLAQAGGYDASTFAWHQRLGVVIAVLAAFAYVWRSRDEAAVSGGYLAVVGLMIVLVGITGHLGGTLTHGEGYLTRYAPDGIRRILGEPPKSVLSDSPIEDPATATVFDTMVKPVLESKCIACHGATVRKGGFRLDTPEEIIDGGEDGLAVVPGRSSESDLIRRLWLPTTDRKHMPPLHRPQVTPAEAEMIRWWIDSGASFELLVADAEPDPAIDLIFESWEIEALPEGVFALDVSDPDTVALAELRAAGMSASLIAEGSSFLQLRCPDADACMTAAHVAAIDRLADQVIWIDLGRTNIGDDAAAALARLPHLTRLHLEQTRVTDAGVTALRGMQYLEYLNLYGTSVTDAAFETLETLPALSSVYLWQTQVTDGAAEAFRASHPDVHVNLGATAE